MRRQVVTCGFLRAWRRKVRLQSRAVSIDYCLFAIGYCSAVPLKSDPAAECSFVLDLCCARRFLARKPPRPDESRFLHVRFGDFCVVFQRYLWATAVELLKKTRNVRQVQKQLRAPNKMTLHSSGLFGLWTASGHIDHLQMACFVFLGRGKNARSRCNDSFC